MRALCFTAAGQPLELQQREIPSPAAGEVLIHVEACGVCRTDLHVQDAELPEVHYPIVPGHQVVGRVVARGDGVRLENNSRAGAAWLAWTCGRCEFCLSGRENLCSAAAFSRLPPRRRLCRLHAGLRRLLPAHRREPRRCNAPRRCYVPGLSATAACAWPATQSVLACMDSARPRTSLRRSLCSKVARSLPLLAPAMTQAQAFARGLGATWAGDSDQASPEKLDAALIFAPVGSLVPKALTDLKPGGRVVCGGIHMSDIPSLPLCRPVG